MSRDNYVAGEREGKQTQWLNGQLMVEYTYKNGQLDGSFLRKSYSYKKTEKLFHYKDGKKHGLCRRWGFHHELGSKGAIHQLVSSINYVNGTRHGRDESWFKNGKPRRSLNFLAGEING